MQLYSVPFLLEQERDIKDVATIAVVEWVLRQLLDTVIFLQNSAGQNFEWVAI